MPALRLPPTAGTSPHFHIKPADDRHPHDILLVLRFGALPDHQTPAVATAWGKRDRNLLIHVAGNRSPSPLPVSSARLAARRLGVGFGFPLGKGGGTSLVGPQRFFQLLAQALVLSQRLLQLLLQRSYSLFKLFFAIRGPTSIMRLHPFDNDTSRRICPVPCFNALYLLGCRMVNILLVTSRLECPTSAHLRHYLPRRWKVRPTAAVSG